MTVKYVRFEHTAPKTAHVDNFRAVWLGAVVLPQLVPLRLLGVFVTGQTETHQCKTQRTNQIVGRARLGLVFDVVACAPPRRGLLALIILKPNGPLLHRHTGLFFRRR